MAYSHQLLGDEFLVNTKTSDIQRAPRVTGLASGGFVMVWQDGPTASADVRAQLFDADGGKVGAEFVVNAATPGGQGEAAVIALSSGGFVVSWTDNSADLTSFDITARLFNAAGAPIGDAFTVNTVTAGSQLVSALTALPSGGFAATWRSGSSNSPNSFDVKAQIFDANGVKSGAEFLVSAGTNFSQNDPTITTLASGRFVISWIDETGSSSLVSPANVKAQIFEANGTKVGGEFTVNAVVVDNQARPSVAALFSGGFVVTWQDPSGVGGDASEYGVKAQIFDGAGQKIGTEFLVNTSTTETQEAPKVIALPAGGFLISWSDEAGDGSGFGVKAQLFNANGSRRGGEFLLNTATDGNQLQPALAVLESGRIVAGWSDGSGQGGDSDASVKAQLVALYLSAAITGTASAETINGTTGNDVIDALSGDDDLFGLAGDDILLGGDGRDRLDGGTGADRMEGGAGDDSYVVDHVADVVDERIGEGVDTVVTTLSSFTLSSYVENLTFQGSLGGVGQGSEADNVLIGAGGDDRLIGGFGEDTLRGEAGADQLEGGGGADLLLGGAGDDRLSGGSGGDQINGGSGSDTLVLSGTLNDYFVVQEGGSWRVTSAGDSDLVTDIELVSLSGATMGWADFQNNAFDGLRYIASNPDLIRTLGADGAAGANHYRTAGRQEGRSLTGFDPLAYGASYPDLISAFGNNAQALSRHYIQSGANEGRIVKFNPLGYAAVNQDLWFTFGYDSAALTQHYVEHGFAEGRVTSSFNPLVYAASYADLSWVFGTDQESLTNHYIRLGRAEGRVADIFNPLQYGALYSDLGNAFGADINSLAAHYINYGRAEGRATSGFDALLYAASNVDLARRYGDEDDAILTHYILYGRAEGRPVDSFDPVAYLLSYPDLGAATLGAEGALRHWVVAGVNEGRSADLFFGDEQNEHGIDLGADFSQALETMGDRDWFSINLAAGEDYRFAVDAAGSGAGTLANPALRLYDAQGRVVAFDDDSGPGNDARLDYITAVGGTFYIVVLGVGDASGSYQVGVDSIIG